MALVSTEPSQRQQQLRKEGSNGMNRFRFAYFLMAAMIVVVLLQSPAEAFWGFGSGRDGGASGLDLEQGYDRNTVVTVTGRVVVTPHAEHNDVPLSLELEQSGGRLVVILGPRWYLQDDDLDWKVGENITVQGSKAQGKDGRTYLLARLVSGSTGRQLVLRNDAGRPGWSGGFKGGQQGTGTAQQRGGAGSRRGR